MFFEGRAGKALLSSFLPPLKNKTQKANNSSIGEWRHLACGDSTEYSAMINYIKIFIWPQHSSLCYLIRCVSKLYKAIGEEWIIDKHFRRINAGLLDVNIVSSCNAMACGQCNIHLGSGERNSHLCAFKIINKRNFPSAAQIFLALVSLAFVVPILWWHCCCLPWIWGVRKWI